MSKPLENLTPVQLQLYLNAANRIAEESTSRNEASQVIEIPDLTAAGKVLTVDLGEYLPVL